MQRICSFVERFVENFSYCVCWFQRTTIAVYQNTNMDMFNGSSRKREKFRRKRFARNSSKTFRRRTLLSWCMLPIPLYTVIRFIMFRPANMKNAERRRDGWLEQALECALWDWRVLQNLLSAVTQQNVLLQTITSWPLSFRIVYWHVRRSLGAAVRGLLRTNVHGIRYFITKAFCDT